MCPSSPPTDSDSASLSGRSGHAKKSNKVSGEKNEPANTAAVMPPSRKSTGTLKSQKLDRTLRELEGAFASWESLDELGDEDRTQTDTTTDTGQQEASDAFSTAQKNERHFRSRTRQLLKQLRAQIKDLSEV